MAGNGVCGRTDLLVGGINHLSRRLGSAFLLRRQQRPGFTTFLGVLRGHVSIRGCNQPCSQGPQVQQWPGAASGRSTVLSSVGLGAGENLTECLFCPIS